MGLIEVKSCPKCGEVPKIFYQPTCDDYPDFYELRHYCEKGGSLGIGGVSLGSIIIGWNARVDDERQRN